MVYEAAKTAPLSPLCADHIRGGRQGLCQGAEKQIQDQALLCQTPTDGLPACSDHLRGGQYGDVSGSCVWAKSHAQTHTHTYT